MKTQKARDILQEKVDEIKQSIDAEFLFNSNPTDSIKKEIEVKRKIIQELQESIIFLKTKED